MANPEQAKRDLKSSTFQQRNRARRMKGSRQRPILSNVDLSEPESWSNYNAVKEVDDLLNSSSTIAAGMDLAKELFGAATLLLHAYDEFVGKTGMNDDCEECCILEKARIVQRKAYERMKSPDSSPVRDEDRANSSYESVPEPIPMQTSFSPAVASVSPPRLPTPPVDPTSSEMLEQGSVPSKPLSLSPRGMIKSMALHLHAPSDMHVHTTEPWSYSPGETVVEETPKNESDDENTHLQIETHHPQSSAWRLKEEAYTDQIKTLAVAKSRMRLNVAPKNAILVEPIADCEQRLPSFAVKSIHISCTSDMFDPLKHFHGFIIYGSLEKSSQKDGYIPMTHMQINGKRYKPGDVVIREVRDAVHQTPDQLYEHVFEANFGCNPREWHGDLVADWFNIIEGTMTFVDCVNFSARAEAYDQSQESGFDIVRGLLVQVVTEWTRPGAEIGEIYPIYPVSWSLKYLLPYPNSSGTAALSERPDWEEREERAIRRSVHTR